MTINQAIVNFRNFLIYCWPSIEKVFEHLDWDNSPYFLEEWMQANWELLVEKQVLETDQLLTSYGYDRSSACRYINADKVITHSVVCKKKSEPNARYYFRYFITKDEITFKMAPPFDLVEVEDIKSGDRFKVSFDDVEFSIETI